MFIARFEYLNGAAKFYAEYFDMYVYVIPR